MPAVHRLNDENDGEGEILTILQTTVKANGKLISIDGSKGSDHGDDEHGLDEWETDNGSLTVKIGGIGINRTGDEDTCEHIRAVGSPDVFAGG